MILRIENIQRVIKVTRKKLEEMNEEFGKHQHPPSIYVQEYEELANKIHEYQLREQRLQEQLSLWSESPPPSPVHSHPYVHPKPQAPEDPLLSPGPPLTPSTNASTTQRHPYRQRSPQAGRPAGSFIKAYLPNNQVTAVPVTPGMPLRDGLAKALRLRMLDRDKCHVFRYNTRIPLTWNTDMAELAGQEVSVELIESDEDNSRLSRSAPRAVVLSHNFGRKTYFSLTFCDMCRNLLFQGIRCQTCGLKFHQRCEDKAPRTCQGDLEIYFRQQREGSREQARQSPRVTHQSRPQVTGMAQRARSTSAPNVSVNLVTNADDMQEDTYSRRSQAKHYADTPLGSRFNFYKEKRHASDSHATIIKNPLVHKDLQCPASNRLTPPVPSPGGSPTKIPHSSPSTGAKPVRTRDVEKRQRIRRDSNEDWEIPNDEIVYDQRIGSGSFGTVFKAHWHGPVAVKKLNVSDPTPSQMQAFKNEVGVLRKTRHCNILLFMGLVSKPHLAIVTQWCDGHSLYQHLHVKETKFRMDQLIMIAKQTAQGMDYLHAKSIIHRDLKSNNIFLTEVMTENMQVKIGDFGLATVKTRWSGSHQFQQPSGSILWMAPEVIRMKEQNPYTFQSDVYAFGIVMYELATGELPYTNINNKDQILFMVGKGYLRPDISHCRSDTPKQFKRLIQDCVQFVREERPLFWQLLASLESLYMSIPKIKRSQSEPAIHRTDSFDSDFKYMCASPKTPINSQFTNFVFTGGMY
ncbi:serine/threonine-protein kinase A-Raf-like isoform X2 [Pomacea canaliculata]|uniref:serine/threonine-protein kinase A-Raf-like isoform X2 n=1 Tax=Pomacea canaliculata TaxID=400727 RepID=UPI000D73785A|nr:serine/threonine-protein kinase A-Raf-like isoform X2 [Pomacea canaliculata]